MRAHAFLGSMLGLYAAACARPGEERTQHDLEVGHARSSVLDVDVAGGLAAVRGLTERRVALWLSAPSVELTLTARRALDVTLAVENAMPALSLTRLETAAVVPPSSGEGATKKTWTLSLPAGTTRVRLAAPEAAENGPFRFALLSDVQEAIDRVQDIFTRVNAEPGLSFLLGAGDLTEEGDTDELERFQSELASLDVPYYTTLGNHELGNEQVPDYADWFGRCNFQFVHRGVYFTLLDSASATIDPTADAWLDTWLARGQDSVHVVAMHIPPFDPVGTRNAAFASRGEAATLVGKLARGKVDLTLYGHIHSYYSFENGGIPAFVSGGGGAHPERADDIGRHFMVIDLDPERGVVSSRVVRVDHQDEDD